jgi:BirA family biotin operon repressor/biotin-[acetyl-CoA-carboxylase] ligase
VIGTPRRHYRLCDSTNTRARELAAAGAPHGTLVTADEQSAGRGRQGRTWTAPQGKALLASFVLRPEPDTAPFLPLAAAAAASEAIESVAPVACQIKWPNDVVISSPFRASAQRGSTSPPPFRKVAGILVEARPSEGWAVLGIGVNVAIDDDEFPEELRDSATSIGSGATVDATLAALTERLDRWSRAEPAEIVGACRDRDALLGLGVAWAGGDGVAVGIDDVGSLLVEVDGSRVALSAGEVHLSLA